MAYKSESCYPQDQEFAIHTVILIAIICLLLLYSSYSTTGSSTSFSFTNLAPDDNTPYVTRVVVHRDTVTSVRTTIRRQIWIPDTWQIWIPGIKLMIVQALLHVCMSLDRKENRVKLGHYIVCVYMWMYRSVLQVRPPFCNLSLSIKHRGGLYAGCDILSRDYALPSGAPPTTSYPDRRRQRI